jgi:hypothetical protein
LGLWLVAVAGVINDFFGQNIAWHGKSFLLMPCMLPKEIWMYWCDYIGMNMLGE